jgi:hypothetical protein
VIAPRWVRWLPAILAFGVINSLLGLVTGHAPTNPNVPVSAVVAGLLCTFYASGSVMSYCYDAGLLSAGDRCALLVYLSCIIWPAFIAHKDLATVTPDIVWSSSIGMIVLGASLATHHMRRRRGAKRSN